MKFSYSAVWEDMLGLIRAHARLLAAIAGVFIFLPALLVAYLLPEPEMADPSRIFQVMIEHYRTVWPWLVLQSLASMVGAAAMLRLVFAPGTSVGGALAFGLMLLPFYFLLSLLSSLIIGLGFILLVVPGLYLIGRLVPAPAVMVAENRRNPVEAIGRSFEITKGHGWAVLGLVLLVAIVAGIVIGVAGALVGIVFILAAGQELGKLLTIIVTSALSAGMATLLLMLYAAIYRGLTGREKVASAFE